MAGGPLGRHAPMGPPRTRPAPRRQRSRRGRRGGRQHRAGVPGDTPRPRPRSGVHGVRRGAAGRRSLVDRPDGVATAGPLRRSDPTGRHARVHGVARRRRALHPGPGGGRPLRPLPPPPAGDDPGLGRPVEARRRPGRRFPRTAGGPCPVAAPAVADAPGHDRPAESTRADGGGPGPGPIRWARARPPGSTSPLRLHLPPRARLPPARRRGRPRSRGPSLPAGAPPVRRRKAARDVAASAGWAPPAPLRGPDGCHGPPAPAALLGPPPARGGDAPGGRDPPRPRSHLGAVVRARPG